MAEAISSGSKDGRATFCNIPDLFEFASQEDLDQELHARSHITTQDLSPKVAVMSLSVAHSSLFISTTPPPLNPKTIGDSKTPKPQNNPKP